MQFAPSFGPDEGLQIGQGRLTQSLDIGYVPVSYTHLTLPTSDLV